MEGGLGRGGAKRPVGDAEEHDPRRAADAFRVDLCGRRDACEREVALPAGDLGEAPALVGARSRDPNARQDLRGRERRREVRDEEVVRRDDSLSARPPRHDGAAKREQHCGDLGRGIPMRNWPD